MFRNQAKLICIQHFLNPYWEIMENSSRNFSEIFIFRVVTRAVLLENSSIFFEISILGRHNSKPFYWKTRPLKIMSISFQYSVFFQIWDVTQTVLLENSSIQIL